MMNDVEFSRPIQVDHLGTVEKEFRLQANPSECQALAQRFDILAVKQLTATVCLTRLDNKYIRLQGHFEADVVQSCVVTLQPVPSHLAEDFELLYAPDVPSETGEVIVDLDQMDPPEMIISGTIDIGEAAAEHLALVLNPFPRLPGAVFRLSEEIEEEEEPADEDPVFSPFAALAALKKK